MTVWRRATGLGQWAAAGDADWRREVLGVLGQMLLIGGIGLASWLLARVGLGGPARLFFLLAGFIIAYWTIRRSPWRYLTLTFWFWTMAPLFRRLIDYQAGFDATSVILGTPSAMTILMLPRILQSPGLLSTREGRIGVSLLVPLFYGMSVNLVRGELVPGLVAAADWLAPLLYYFYFLTLAGRIAEAEAPVKAFLTANMAVIGAYGLQQYFAPADWDVAWIKDSGLIELGGPPLQPIRLFATMNMPGPMASWLGTILLMALHFRTRLMLLALPAIGIVLVLSLVRGVMGVVLLSLCIALVVGRGQNVLGIVKAVALLAMVIGGFGTYVVATDVETADRVLKRFDTVKELEYDVSAESRRKTYAAAPALIDAAPLGLGIAVLGRGAVAAGEGQVVIDAGPLAIYLALGWIGGTVYLLALFLLAAHMLVGARTSGSMAGLVVGVAALSNIIGVVFSNPMGVQAAMLWFCAGYANALLLAWRQAQGAQTGITHHPQGWARPPHGCVTLRP